MQKRILALLLVLVLVLGLLPLGAFAEEEAPTTEPTAAQTVATEPETEPTQTESAEQGETTSPTLVGSAMQQEQTAELTEAAPAEDADAAASPEPVIVTDLPAFVPVKTGDPCTLTVTAEGTGTLTYQWYACSDNVYKGNKIKNATGASYSPATLKEEIAYYYVEITNTEEGKTPTMVRSAIVKVGVSDDGTGTFSETPVITSDVHDLEDVVLPWNSLKGREFNFSIKELGMTSLSYQWYKNTERSYEGAEAIPGATKGYYHIRGTTVLGTNYYFCEITNTLEDGITRSTRTAIGSLTIKAPEKMEFGIVIGEEPVGKIRIRVRDDVPQRDDLVDGMGEAFQDPGPYGDLVGNPNSWGTALIYPSDTMMTIIARALIEDGHRQVGGEKGYISAIIANYGTENSVELAEFRRGKGSGWMGTLNGWCTNLGFANYTVANGDIQDGDTIDVRYTTDLGKDIGCDFDATDASLESLTLMVNDRIDPDRFVTEKKPADFSGDKYSYELVLDSGITAFKVQAAAAEKQFQTKIFVGDTEYRMNSGVIPFTDSTLTLTIKTVKPASGTTEEIEGKTYTVTLIRDQKLLKEEGDMTLDLLLKDGSLASQEALVPSYSEQGRSFGITVSAYTADESKNVTGFILHLPNLPEGSTGEVVTPSGTSYPITDGTATVQDEIARYGNFDFVVRLHSGENYGIYTLSIYKSAATVGLRTCVFNGVEQSFDPGNTYNGQPEGTLLRVDEQGQETGEIGLDTNWFEYDLHMTEKIQTLKSQKNTSIMMLGMAKVTILVNGEVVYGPKLTPSAGISMQLSKNIRIKLSGTRTDLSFRIENPKNASDVVTYTFHIIRHSIEASELETMIRALPEADAFLYSEHLMALEQAKKLFEEAKAEVQAEVAPELVEKLNALWAEKERQYQEGKALIDAVQAEVSKYMDAIPEDTTELTDELYQ